MREGLEAIADELVPGGRLIECRPLMGGVSATVRSLSIEGPNGETLRFVLRGRGAEWKGGDGSLVQEAALLASLHARGLPVPRSHWVDESCERLPEPFFVMDHVEGSAIPTDVRNAPEQLAELLATIHAVETAGLELAPIEDPLEHLPMYLPSTEAGEEIRASIEAMVYEPPAPSLLHGDFWPGNVLWREETIAAVVDWEDASLGDPMSDLAASRVELLCSHGRDAMDRFTTHYGARRTIHQAHLDLWALYVSSAALATMEHWGLAADVEARRRTLTTQFFEEAAAHISKTIAR